MRSLSLIPVLFSSCLLALPGQGALGASLDFDSSHYTVESVSVNGHSVRYRAYRDVVYVANPVDVKYQSLNFFVPEDFFEGKVVNGYTAETAPIFLPNTVGGYMPGLPGGPGQGRGPGLMAPPPGPSAGGPPPGAPQGLPPGPPSAGMDPGPGQGAARPSAMAVALSRGLVVASPGARGRTLKDVSGGFSGKAPACIVDLKAAVRYLRYNDKRMAGDAERIITNGTSAGGALSALQGATGNSADYEPYLKALGAAEARDDVFASSCYCPITNLDHADAAYEWLFAGINTCDNRGRKTEMNAAQIEASRLLKPLFTPYLNSLGLVGPDGVVLGLDEKGDGSFAELVKRYVMASAQQALVAGKDLSKLSWLSVRDGKVVGMDLQAFAVAATRQKETPAFDDLDMRSPETNLFGTATVDNLHFTEFSAFHGAVHARADVAVVRLMNPLNYIGTPNATTARHWRIRHGTADRDTSLAIPVILATRLKNAGCDVDFFLPWAVPHSGDYDLDELFTWIDRVCR